MFKSFLGVILAIACPPGKLDCAGFIAKATSEGICATMACWLMSSPMKSSVRNSSNPKPEYKLLVSGEAYAAQP